MARCPECGYDDASAGRTEILAAVPELAGEHSELLRSVPAARLREHTRAGSWSPLEYGCHVRDMLATQRDRVLLAQTERTPRFASMRRDERAVEESYNEQDPLVVADDIAAAARAFGRALAALDDAGWQRTGVYPWPEPDVRTVEWIGRRTVHELVHHLFDNRRLLAG
ncbi:MAG TPA: DinB family protein [Streptosporangiaceae bacterium]|nr:DinB family protein [Streptosporangiaceae bacterium]